MTPLDFQSRALPGCYQHDEIIDVRSPSEFALDHIPGAVNLPVLYDNQRVSVGTIYKQVSPFEARKCGAAIITAMISRHLESHFNHKPKTYRPFLYCWRGGQRSQSMATILGAIGWRVTVLQGGYKTYRIEVMEGLKSRIPQFQFRIIGGMTGSGKSLILRKLEEMGHQILDLETIASHRGSSLGAEPECPQPAQRLFESKIFAALNDLDPSRPVWMEAESHRIGDLLLPTGLWDALKTSQMVEIHAHVQARASFLIDQYQHYLINTPKLFKDIQSARRFVVTPEFRKFKALADQGRFQPATEILLESHYDPAYKNSTGKWFQSPTAAVDIKHLTTPNITKAAQQCINVFKSQERIGN